MATISRPAYLIKQYQRHATRIARHHPSHGTGGMAHTGGQGISLPTERDPSTPLPHTAQTDSFYHLNKTYAFTESSF